ncbi:MAG: hypothetical protein ABFD10_09075 [Prolixibacteraceae bacterium]
MDRKELNPVRGMLYFFVTVSGLSALSSILGRSFFLDSLWFLAIPSMSFSVLLFCGGLIGFRLDFTIADFEKDIHRNGTLNGEGMDCPDEGNGIRTSLLKEKLLSLLEDQRLYTQPDLRITDLARRMGSNRAYVSRQPATEYKLFGPGQFLPAEACPKAVAKFKRSSQYGRNSGEFRLPQPKYFLQGISAAIE